MASLVPCSACQRHIRVDHGACPFCAAPVPADFARGVIPAATRRLDRLAIMTFTTALSVAACGAIADDGTGARVGDAGVERLDGGADARAWRDEGNVAPSYGASPFDAGHFDAARLDAAKKDGGGVSDEDGGAPGPMYGLPVFDDGGGATLYGLPPLDASID